MKSSDGRLLAICACCACPRCEEHLLSARGQPVTVTEIATDFGFAELGRFSVEYRKVFGESPSETLYHAAFRIE